MGNEDKTKEQLLETPHTTPYTTPYLNTGNKGNKGTDELVELRQRITELEKSEIELQKTKAMFQGLFECAPDAIVVVNSEGRIVEANTQAEKIFGYSKNELLDKHVEVLIPERFRKRHDEHMRRYMSKPHIRFMGSELELYGLRKDGTEFPVDIALGPLETKDGIMVLSIVRDITEHMRMEEALRTSEAKYRSIFENAVEGIFQTSVEGRILAANPALAHMLGYESQEEIITSVTDARKLYVEPGRRLQLVRTIRAHGIMTNFEAQIRRKDGSKIWVLINAHALYDSSRNIVGLEGMVTDITNRKRAERNFQMLIDSAPDAIVAVDSSYNILLINTQTESIFGYKREELLGKSYDILIPGRFREKHAGYCAGYFAEPTTKKMALHLGAVAVRKDGSEFPVEINMSPIETEEGIIVVTDIRDSSGRICAPK